MTESLISSQTGSRNIPQAAQFGQRQISEKKPLDREKKGRNISDDGQVGAALGMTRE